LRKKKDEEEEEEEASSWILWFLVCAFMQVL
jgi:hypothetical protein